MATAKLAPLDKRLTTMKSEYLECRFSGHDFPWGSAQTENLAGGWRRIYRVCKTCKMERIDEYNRHTFERKNPRYVDPGDYYAEKGTGRIPFHDVRRAFFVNTFGK